MVCAFQIIPVPADGYDLCAESNAYAACRGSCSGLGSIGPIDRSQSASEAEALTAVRTAQQMPR